MINNMFNKNVTLQDYNEYVFNFDTIKKLKHLIDLPTYEHGHNFYKIINFCQLNNIKWYIYTNAHINWILYFSYLLDLPIGPKNIIWPFDLSLLKPYQVSYDLIEREINGSYIMVDDSLINLSIPNTRPNKWIPIHFKENDKADFILSEIQKHI